MCEASFARMRRRDAAAEAPADARAGRLAGCTFRVRHAFAAHSGFCSSTATVRHPVVEQPACLTNSMKNGTRASGVVHAGGATVNKETQRPWPGNPLPLGRVDSAVHDRAIGRGRSV